MNNIKVNVRRDTCPALYPHSASGACPACTKEYEEHMAHEQAYPSFTPEQATYILMLKLDILDRKHRELVMAIIGLAAAFIVCTLLIAWRVFGYGT